MFNFVHQVRILVHNAENMVTYLEQTFAMTPVTVQVYESRGMKNTIYQVGETNLEFTEPLDANSEMGQFLEREGPGVYHSACGVDGIVEVAQGLVEQGKTLSGKGSTSRSAEGYVTATLDPASALGCPFQVAAGQARWRQETGSA